MKKVLYLHNTPLAALAALERVGRLSPQAWTLYLHSLPAEAHQAGFLATGQDEKGHDVFALWYRARLNVLQRFVESLLDLLQSDHQGIKVNIVGYPHPGVAIGLFLYRLGLRLAGHLCLRLVLPRHPAPSKRPPELTPLSRRCIIGAEFGYDTGEKLGEEKRASRR